MTYKAFDTNLRIPAALKVINSTFLQSESARQRFLREARAAAKLRHPNVATIYYLGHEGVENYFYAMELIEGETFDALLAREGPLPVGRALELTLQVTRALIAAHAVGMIHRDIKPSNLMLTQQQGEPLVKVIDFGLVKAVDPEPQSGESGALQPVLTRTGGGFVGTPFYASPEQLENLPLDTRSDIYSLGVTLWFLLTGHPPFHGGSFARVLSEHLTKPPPFQELPTLPAATKRLLERMLAKQPDGRPQNPTELRDEILACLREIPGAGTTPSPKALERALSPAAAAAIPVSPAAVTAPVPPPAAAAMAAVEVGVVLNHRFRLDDRLGPSVFRALDLDRDEPVALRLVTASTLHAVTAAAERWPAAAAEAEAIIRPRAVGALAGGGGFVAMEWIEGTSTLLELVKHRGAVSLGEALSLLDPLAHANAALRGHGLEGAHLELPHVLLQSVPSGRGVTPRVLPAELFAPEGSVGQIDQTFHGATSAVPSLASGSDPRAFGRLACELLGGPARDWLDPDSATFTPLSALNEAGNVMLRRCLTSAPPGSATGDGGGEGYASGAEFVAALHRSVEGIPHAGSFALAPTEPAPGHAAHLAPPVAVEIVADQPRSGGMRSGLAFAAILLVTVGLAVAVWLVWGRRGIGPSPRSPAPSSTPSTPAAGSAPRSQTFPRLVPGRKLIPFGPDGLAVPAGVWPVRGADFTSFITASSSAAEGDIFSIGPDGKRRALGCAWRWRRGAREGFEPEIRRDDLGFRCVIGIDS